MSRSKHHGCGKSCSLCKPWKHGFEDKLKPSERRESQDDIEDEEAEYREWKDRCTDGDCDMCLGYVSNIVTLTPKGLEAIENAPREATEEMKALFKEFKDML